MDEEGHVPLIALPKNTNTNHLKIMQRVSQLAGLSNPTIQGVRTVNLPTNTDETFSFCQELLQYKMVQDIRDLQGGGWTTAQTWEGGRPVIEGSVQTPKKPPQLIKIPGQEILKALSANRFSNGDGQKFYWEHLTFALPDKTRLFLRHVPSSPQSGVEKRIVLFSKPYFYTIEITIEPIGAGSSVPRAFDIAPDQAHRYRTYQFVITMDAKFEKWTAGNWQTDGLKAWVKWLFSAIESKLVD
jgi:hypothetical protein